MKRSFLHILMSLMVGLTILGAIFGPAAFAQPVMAAPHLQETPVPPDVDADIDVDIQPADPDPDDEVLADTGDNDSWLANWLIWIVLGVVLVAALIALLTRAFMPPTHHHHDHFD